MLSDKKIEIYKENKQTTVVFNIKIERTDRIILKDIVSKKGLSMSEVIRLLIKEFIRKQKGMLSDKKIKEYKKKKKTTVVFNFLIEKTDRDLLLDITNKKGLYMSEVIRPLIKEFIKESKKRG